MKKGILIVLVSLLALAGCVERTPLPPYLGLDTMSDIDEEKWLDYGAVYLYDELRITADFGQSDRRFLTRYTVNQAVKILDRSGVKHGTIDLIQFPGDLKEFEVVHHDASGRAQQLDMEALKDQYLDTSKVVIPRVQPGSVISLKYSFADKEPMMHYDHVIAKDLPVLQSAFYFLSSHDMRYNVKSYGFKEIAEEVRTGRMKGYKVSKRDIKPLVADNEQNYSFLADWQDFTDLPRTNVQMETFWISEYHYKAPDWEKIADDFRRYYHSPSIFSARGKIEKQTAKLVTRKASEHEKARAILGYVQNNIALQRHNEGAASRVDIGEVLEKKTATMLEMSVLLSEMFKTAGLEVRQYITRPPSSGGFDGSIPSWSQLVFPLVSVVTESSELIAYPYQQLYRIGEYPPELEGLSALDLDKGEVVPLPPSIHRDGQLRSSVEISLNSPDDEYTWQYALGNHYAALYRGYLNSLSDYSLERFGMKILESYGDQNTLNDISSKKWSSGEVIMNMTVHNENLDVSHKDGRAISLQPFFSKILH